jgi:tryptophan-rich sensory protein
MHHRAAGIGPRIERTALLMDRSIDRLRSSATSFRPALAWSIAAGAIVGVLAIGALFPPGDWYAALNKPTWQPPNWLFGPVWTTLYAMLAVALALLLQAPPGPRRNAALGWFGAQLLLNAAWSPLFFGLQQPALAFVSICLLWLVLLGSILAAFKLRALVGWLQVPTLAWVSFALVLNGVIVALNGV